MLSVGITGGIGSGKTTVCRYFEFLGVPVYYADIRAKKLMVENLQLSASIKSVFGEDAYLTDGNVNREFLAQMVFNDADMLKRLNNLVHPAVWKDTAEWIGQHSKEAYILYEAAILFESESYKMLNKTITVFAPEELRIRRVMERDGSSRNDVLVRMKNQMSDEKKMELADYIIYNDHQQLLVGQILELNRELIRISGGL